MRCRRFLRLLYSEIVSDIPITKRLLPQYLLTAPLYRQSFAYIPRTRRIILSTPYSRLIRPVARQLLDVQRYFADRRPLPPPYLRPLRPLDSLTSARTSFRKYSRNIFRQRRFPHQYNAHA